MKRTPIPIATSCTSTAVIGEGWTGQFEMDDSFDYEPQADASVAARAAAAGVSPESYAYDLMLANEGTGFIYLPILNYADGNLDFLEELQGRDDCVNSLSDGGAHCGTICDAASPTFMLGTLGARQEAWAAAFAGAGREAPVP